ncbi:hypothetical protein ASF77_08185 [Massilia sp. Leaf139]|nr:hypothetical protein ASF77_08185 [Massilia sp. Leaf139]
MSCQLLAGCKHIASFANDPKQSLNFPLDCRICTIRGDKPPAPFGLIFLKTLQANSQTSTIYQLSIVNRLYYQMTAIRLRNLSSVFLWTTLIGSDAVSKIGKISRRRDTGFNRDFEKSFCEALECNVAIRMLSQQPRTMAVFACFGPAAGRNDLFELRKILTIDSAPSLL